MSELLQPLHIEGLQPAIPVGLDTVRLPDLVDRTASVGLFQNGHDLGLGELRLAHENLLAKGNILPESSPVESPQIG